MEVLIDKFHGCIAHMTLNQSMNVAQQYPLVDMPRNHKNMQHPRRSACEADPDDPVVVTAPV